MNKTQTNLHTFRGTPLVLRRTPWRAQDLEVVMLNGLPDYDRLAGAEMLPYGGSYYDDYRRHAATLDMARATVTVGALILRNTDLEEFLSAIKGVAEKDNRLVRVERFVKLPFGSPMLWVTTTVYEPTIEPTMYGNGLEITPGVVLTVGSDPVVFVEGC